MAWQQSSAAEASAMRVVCKTLKQLLSIFHSAATVPGSDSVRTYGIQ